MKLYKQLRYMSVALFGALALTGCSDDNDWQAGEAYDTKNQVSVASDSSESIIVGAGETGSVTVTFSRESSEGAASITLDLTDSENFTASKLEFADGESTATAEVSFKGTQTLGVYSCEVSVPFGEYNNPYSESTNACHIEALVGEWEVINSNVYVYNDDLNTAYGFPKNIICSLEHFTGTSRYRLKDFAIDYDFTFEIGANNYVTPLGGSWYGTNYWYFGTDTWNSESPLIFKEDTTHKLGWAYIYLGGYSAVNLSTGFGYLYLGDGYWTSVDDDNDYKEISWSYLYIWWDTITNLVK